MAVMAPDRRSISRFLILADRVVGAATARRFFSRDTLEDARVVADQAASRGYAAKVIDIQRAPAVYTSPAPSSGG